LGFVVCDFFIVTAASVMTINGFSIGKHVIGKAKAFIIAEVAQAHDGSKNISSV